jgi:4-hydroxy-2-oxoheptanedioate aldolase
MPQNISSGRTPLHQSLERAGRQDGPSVGQWLELPGYSLARTVAPLGEDVCLADPLIQNDFGLTNFSNQWVLIDTEHGNIDDNEMYLQVGAISSAGVSPIVRVPGSEHWMIKRALDCGAHGIIVPMCETKVTIHQLQIALYSRR